MEFIIKSVIFLIVSGGIVFISKASLRTPRSHGFYRFFAWEITLILFLLNMDFWFHDPFSWHQIFAWILLVVSLPLILHAVYLFKKFGKPDKTVKDKVPKLGIEKTTNLVTSGAYRYIRHPFYSSLLFLAWGIFFKHLSWLGFFLALAATTALACTAKSEEKENRVYFGPAYEEYMQGTKMFIPFIF